MNHTVRWTVAAGAALALLSACGEDAPGPAAAAASQPAWQGVATDCPRLTAPAFAGLELDGSGAKTDEPDVLSIRCGYGAADARPSLVLNLQLNRNPDAHGQPARHLEGKRKYAELGGHPVIDLPGDAVLLAAPGGAAEAVAASGNAILTALAQFDEPLDTEAALVAHQAELEQSLNDLIANLR
ncbi:hypothetical protein [Actinoplanes sp. DH11]|uniref:hypothetical protein n=1 Tax=Actinoplanes sp. DH11 TaxID=2857011 RepID=UPI001E2B07EF|nr:hypothetical protein [Actinoplanes sp. DH11]